MYAAGPEPKAPLGPNPGSPVPRVPPREPVPRSSEKAAPRRGSCRGTQPTAEGTERQPVRQPVLRRETPSSSCPAGPKATAPGPPASAQPRPKVRPGAQEPARVEPPDSALVRTQARARVEQPESAWERPPPPDGGTASPSCPSAPVHASRPWSPPQTSQRGRREHTPPRAAGVPRRGGGRSRDFRRMFLESGSTVLAWKVIVPGPRSAVRRLAPPHILPRLAQGPRLRGTIDQGAAAPTGARASVHAGMDDGR